MQPFPQPQQAIVQCPYCGGSSVPPTALPAGTIVACPTCRQQFVYQGQPLVPVAQFPQAPLLTPSYPAGHVSKPIHRNSSPANANNNLLVYVIAGVGVLGTLIAVLLVVVMTTFNRNVATTNPQPSTAESPAAAASASSQKATIPATSFLIPPLPKEARRQVDIELARLAQVGEPITVEQLRAYHVGRPLTNDKTDAWVAALKNLSANGPPSNSTDFGHVLRMIEGRTIKSLGYLDRDSKSAEPIVAKVGPQLDAIVALGHDPGQCRFPVPFEEGMQAKLDHVPLVRYAVQFLAARARFQLHRSQRDELYHTLFAMLSVIRTLDEGATLTEQAARITAFEIACHSITDALKYGGLTPEQLDNLALALTTVDVSHAAARGMMSWRVFFIMAWDNPGSLPREMMQWKGVMREVVLPPKASDLDRAFCLGFQAQLLDAQREPMWTRLDKMDDLERDFKALDKFTANVGDDYSYSQVICREQWRLGEAFANTEAVRLTTHVGLKCRAFQIRNSRWPENLAECGIVGMDATDPFDGKPLHYRVDGKEMRVSSIGINRKETGGKKPKYYIAVELKYR